MSSRRDLGDTDRNIYVMDADGNDQTNITLNSPIGCTSKCYQGDDDAPAWSPDTTVANDINPDWQPITLQIGDVRVKEKNTSARFTVSLSGASQETVTVNYATANGSAKAPADYTTTTGTLTFSPGQTTQTVAVRIKDDKRKERNETFFVNLSNANTTVADASGKGTIVDKD